MHRILSLAVTVGLLFAPSAVVAQGSKAPSFQFVKKDTAVGDVVTTDTRVEMKMDFALFGPQMEPESMVMTSTSVDRYTVTVLEAHQGLIDKVKIAFEDVYEEQADNGNTQRKAHPVSGKVYAAGLVKGKVAVTDEAGNPVSQEEQTDVAGRLPELGKVDPLEAALPTTPLKVGASLDRFAKVLTTEVLQQEGDPNTRFSGTRVRLSEVTRDARGTLGIFRITTTMTTKDPESPVVLTVPLEGQMTARAEGAELLEFTLAGPMRLAVTPKVRKQGLSVKGSGEMKMHVSSSPRR